MDDAGLGFGAGFLVTGFGNVICWPAMVKFDVVGKVVLMCALFCSDPLTSGVTSEYVLSVNGDLLRSRADRCELLNAAGTGIGMAFVGNVCAAVYGLAMADAIDAGRLKACDFVVFGGSAGFIAFVDGSMRSPLVGFATVVASLAPSPALFCTILIGNSSCIDFVSLASVAVDGCGCGCIMFSSLLPICFEMVVIFAGFV